MSTWDTLTNEQLATLPTHRLYQVYKRFRQCTAYLGYRSGWDDNCTNPENIKAEATCKFIKSILDLRGHIERSDEPEVKPYHERSKKSQAREDRKWSYYWRNKSVEYVKPCLIQDPEACIGKQVFKISRKPFKSKNFYNTVKAISVNPHTNKKAFTFEEDRSIVDVDMCDSRKVKK